MVPVLLICCFLLLAATAAAAKSLQSCPTLWDPIDGSPPGSPVPGTLQARTLEWVATSFSNAWKWKVKVKSLSRVRLLRHHGLQPTRLLRPWDFPGKSMGVGCHCLLLLLLSSSLFYGCSIVLLFIHPIMDFWIILESLGFCEKTFININVDVFVGTYVSILRGKYL